MRGAVAGLVLVAACHRDPERVFWSWFADHAAALAKLDRVAAVAEIQDHLDRVDDTILVEIGDAGSDELLVITADGDKEKFDEIQHLVAQRPAVPGWQVAALRQRDVARPLPALEMTGERIEPAKVRFVGVRDGAKLDVQLFLPGYADSDKTLGMLAFLMLDHVIGEYDTEMAIGKIDMEPLERAGSDARPIDQLPAAVDALR